MENFYRSYYQVIEATEENINASRHLPALILIYSSIDSVSWIASDDSSEKVGKRFRKWVNKWMLKQGKINCSADELYAARCAILHTFTPSIEKRDKVRSIVYAYGDADIDNVDEAISSMSIQNKYVSVHMGDLFQCFRDGFADYFDYAFSCESEKTKLLEKSKKHFAYVEPNLIDSVVELSKNKRL